ncbi:hypothetical protein M9H77_06578 [Catharanthus roseus]|uniref:Uncharacterized protein n=1 Tax=Catharanthus roseus TaxID=4058 RepID=A0ACC0BSX1_CATRO|nr:hypothetical protein M9H77_06578 [Catharanthus roseus]
MKDIVFLLLTEEKGSRALHMQDSLPSTQTNQQTPAQQDPLTLVQQDPPHKHRYQLVLTLHQSSRSATHILAILHERFISPYHRWSEVLSDVRDMWWRVFHVKVGDQMRDFLNVLGADDKQTDLMEWFSKSRHLEELHKHQSGDKKGQYVDFLSEEFWMSFGYAKEEATAMSILLPDDLQLMATVSGGLDLDQLYGAGSEAAHLRVERSRAAARLPPCFEAVVFSAYTTFNEHMRRFAKQSHLPYILMPPMMDIVRAAMAAPFHLHHHRWQQLRGLQMRRGYLPLLPLPHLLMPQAPTPLILPPLSGPLVMLEITMMIDSYTF